MSDDLIKRSDAIESLGEEPYVWTDDDEFAQGERSQWINDVSAIKAVPSTDRPKEWVPCSERPPEEEGEYLVTAKKYAFDSSYYDVQIAYCSPNKKWFNISNCEILAWMPRPKPYKGADR